MIRIARLCRLALACAGIGVLAHGQTLADEPRVAWKHFSSADGTLPPPNGGTQQTACVTFDIDGNGTADIVIAERTQAPSVLALRWTGSGWERLVIDAARDHPEAGGVPLDVDRDGDLDLILGGDYQSDALWWYENPAPNLADAPSWVRREIKRGGGTAHHDQAVGDFLGIGSPQVAFWNQGARKLLLARVPADPRALGHWPITELLDTSTVATATKQEGMDAADVDGDGQLDLLAGLYWFKLRPGGRLEPIQIAPEPGRILAARFRPGKSAQIVVGPGDGTGRLWLHDCGDRDPTDPGAWTRRDLLGRDVVHGHTLAIGDVDLDGNLDILCAEMAKWTERQTQPDHPDAHAWILHGDGAGGFETTIFQRGFGFHEAKLADVNGDGRLDIVSKPYNWKTPRIDVWLNQPARPTRD